MITGAKIQTFTIVAGNMACNASCPDCVSKMTTKSSMQKPINYLGIDFENLKVASALAMAGGATTILFTGKGEPTLFPQQLLSYLEFFDNPDYSQLAIKELQTNALLFQHADFLNEDGWLQKWFEKGLRVISISIISTEDSDNRDFYCPSWSKYPKLIKTISILHKIGYTVRLNVTMMKPHISSGKEVEEMVLFCKKNGVEQLSMRPMRKTFAVPANSETGKKVWQWVDENELTSDQEKNIVSYVDNHPEAYVLRNLVHGAKIYDFRGQNLCLTDCLTIEADNSSEVRQLIFYSGGLLSYDWQSSAAVILGWGKEVRKYVAGEIQQFETKMAETGEY